ncbi:HAD-IB family hydrolase [Schumannella luteola]|uniref:HAD superfamily hydrolase (TIGR01490 family) n=1 Tax=Schumannella luteola TaxID=472059 RepID=A0A852Y5Q3_9MICO|nr:HAD-IB family hydrolase [Schumannella luteola]NYG97583.1 HAD superfamily hydrolase (TIGR01490 family) [Schumannella luteola]TPX01568.1 HAD-IB family hydrolase [Schumannella luteola]
MSDETGATSTAGAEPSSDRPIVAFFDVDNTLMRGTSLFHVGVEAFRRKVITWRDIAPFVWHQVRFTRVGENDAHLASARERALELVAGKTPDEIAHLAESIWEDRINPRLWPETVALAQAHIAKGHEVWLISATPWEVGDVIARRLGLTGALGTRVEVVDGQYTGRLVGHVMHGERKAVAARELAGAIGADLADCWAYSDSRNDLPLLELVGNRIVVNPDAALHRHADENAWPVMQLQRSSLREAQKRVKREARAVRKSARRASATAPLQNRSTGEAPAPDPAD